MKSLNGRNIILFEYKDIFFMTIKNKNFIFAAH